MEPRFTPLDLPDCSPRQYFNGLWESIERQNNVWITLHDHTGSLLLSDGGKLRNLGNIHRAEYCTFCRRRYRKKCVEHCRWLAMREASQRGGAFVSCCHAGAVELLLPLMRRGEHVATAFIGTFRDPELTPPESWSAAQRELYESLPLWHRSRVPQLLRLLEMFCAAALNFADNERSVPHDVSGRRGEIEDFFRCTLASPDITLNDLAEKLNLSLSRTSHILRMEFNKGFSKLLNEARIERACKLLRTTPLSLREVALLTGFGNVYYFGRVFRRCVGIPPGEFHRQAFRGEFAGEREKS